MATRARDIRLDLRYFCSLSFDFNLGLFQTASMNHLDLYHLLWYGIESNHSNGRIGAAQTGRTRCLVVDRMKYDPWWFRIQEDAMRFVSLGNAPVLLLPTRNEARTVLRVSLYEYP